MVKMLRIYVEYEDIKKSISLTKRISRNMYLYNIQFEIWHSRVSTNTRLCKMKIVESELCEFCAEPETIEHDFVWCDHANRFCSDFKIWLYNIGYHNFRLEHKITILGDKQKD